MNIFKSKSKSFGTSTQSVSPKTEASAQKSNPATTFFKATSNAYVEPGAGHIDFGAKAAARVAGETRDLLESKRIQAENARLAASESHRLVASSDQVKALQQPGALATLNRITRVGLGELEKPAWANAFLSFGLDSFLMDGLNKIIDLELSDAKKKTDAGVKTMTSQQMRNIWDAHLSNALTIAQSAYDKRGVTVSLSYYRDPVTLQAYVDFTVPTSLEEKELWQKQLLSRFGSFIDS